MEKTFRVRGVVPVLLTPFNADESIDVESLRKEVDCVIGSGACAICAPAFASEHYKLSDAERFEVLKIVVEQAASRVPLFVSTSSGSVHNTVELSRTAQSVGAYGVMVAAPGTISLGGEELFAYFDAVCRGVSSPVMIQDVDFLGRGLPVSLFTRLVTSHRNLLFVKLEHILPGEKCAEIIRLSNNGVQVLYGMGGIAMFDGFEHGASAIMPGAALVSLYHKIVSLYDAGLVNLSKSLFYRLQPYLTFGLQHLELHLAMEKYILMRRGIFASERLREPTLRLGEIYRRQAEDLSEMVIALMDEAESITVRTACQIPT